MVATNHAQDNGRAHVLERWIGSSTAHQIGAHHLRRLLQSFIEGQVAVADKKSSKSIRGRLGSLRAALIPAHPVGNDEEVAEGCGGAGHPVLILGALHAAVRSDTYRDGQGRRLRMRLRHIKSTSGFCGRKCSKKAVGFNARHASARTAGRFRARRSASLPKQRRRCEGAFGWGYLRRQSHRVCSWARDNRMWITAACAHRT